MTCLETDCDILQCGTFLFKALRGKSPRGAETTTYLYLPANTHPLTRSFNTAQVKLNAQYQTK